MRLTAFTFWTLAIAFAAFVFPVSALGHLLFGTRILAPGSLIPTLAVAAAMAVYVRTHASSPVLRGFLHYGLGVGFIGLCVLSAGLLLSVALPGASQGIGLAALAIVTAASARALANGRSLRVKRLDIVSPKVGGEVSLVFISDVHLGSNPRSHLKRIRSMVDAIDHDGLLIGGDLFDASDFTPEDLAPLDGIGKPMLFVTGNHEFYVRDHEAKIGGLAERGVTLLDNRGTRLKGLNVVGVGDNQTAERQARVARGLVRADGFNLVLAHRPSLWEHVPEHTDLMLSGHTHNGQIVPFNLLVALQHKTIHGLYRKGRSTLYVSSGCGCWGPRMRLGTRNEIVHVTIKPR